MMAEFSEGLSPKERNRDIIVSSWPRLKDSIRENKGEVALPLVDPLSLRWSLFPTTENDAIKAIRTDIVTIEGKTQANLNFTFYKDPTYNTVVVSSKAATEVSQESKGYGSGLVLLTNDVIEDSIQRFPEEFVGKNVVAVIVDVARGQEGGGKERKDWSSDLAEKLGYEFDADTQVWYRVYKAENGNIDLLGLKRVNS